MKQTILIPTCITQNDSIEFPNDGYQADALKVFASLTPDEMLEAIGAWYWQLSTEQVQQYRSLAEVTGRNCRYCGEPVMLKEIIAVGDNWHRGCIARKLENEKRFQAMAG